MLSVLLLVLVCFTSLSQSGIFNSKGDIKIIDVERLKRHLASSSKATMVAFFAPWCGHCRNLAPEFDKAATNVNNLVTFAAIDCDAKENSLSCQSEYQVRGYPTLMYFSGLPIPKPYEGQRKAKDMVEYSLKHMPNFSKKVKNQLELTKLISKSTQSRPLVVLFSKSVEVAPLYKALSSVLAKKFDVYFSAPTTIDTEAMKAKYGIESVPKVVMFKGDLESDRILYDGKMNYKALFDFFKSNSPSNTTKTTTTTNKDEKIKKEGSNPKASGEL